MDSADKLPVRTCETPSTGSEKWLIQTTTRALEAYPDRVTEHTPLVPVEAAKAVAEAIDSRSAPCAPHVSHSFAAQLIGLYPSREVNDPTTYLAGITALFSAYSEDFVRRVCDPVVGLPASSKWFPAIAEIKAALEAEKTKRDNILFNARWTLAEHARRRSKAEDEAHLKPGTSEERAAAVERIMKAYPINPMEAA